MICLILTPLSSWVITRCILLLYILSVQGQQTYVWVSNTYLCQLCQLVYLWHLDWPSRAFNSIINYYHDVALRKSLYEHMPWSMTNMKRSFGLTYTPDIYFIRHLFSKYRNICSDDKYETVIWFNCYTLTRHIYCPRKSVANY